MKASKNGNQSCIEHKTYYTARSKIKLFGKKIDLITYINLRDPADIKLEFEVLPPFGGAIEGSFTFELIVALREELSFLEKKKTFLENLPKDSCTHLIKSEIGGLKVNCAHNKKTAVIIQFSSWTIERELSHALITELDDFMHDVSIHKEVIRKKIAQK